MSENNNEETLSEIEKYHSLITTKRRNMQEEEENECEQLIKVHLNIPDCSLMTEGYHTKRRKFYFCPCDPDCQNPLCYICLKKCHFNHWNKLNKKVDECITDKRSAVCHCGLKNHIVSELIKNIEFIYVERCQFLEWSITSNNYIYYNDINNPDEILCMFCYHYRGQPENYIKKSDELLCRRLKCSDRHDDYLVIAEKIGKIISEVPFNFEKLIEIQFINVILKSHKSFENGFHKVNLTLNFLKDSISNKEKKNFDFDYFVNNSPFIKSLQTICKILNICHSNYYVYQFIDLSDFIFPILLSKFNYKGQASIWELKNYLFHLYHVLNFKKDFEIIPNYSVKDIINLNPFQRIIYSNYINLFPEIEEKYFNLNNEKKNYIDNLLLVLEKYNKIKYNDENKFQILKRIFAECKIFICHNKFTHEQLFKYFSLVDDIVLNYLDTKDITLSFGYEKMKMISQITKSLLYLSYYFNDNMLMKFFNGEISLTELTFIHAKSDSVKMIYRNCSHIILICRSIHDACFSFHTNEIKNESERFNYTQSNMKKASLISEIDKLQNKILFMTNEMTGLTLNYPDPYIFGLKKLFNDKNNIVFFNYINGVFSENEKTIFDEMKDICCYLEKIYNKFYIFEINSEQVEEEVYEKIEEFFRIISKENYEPPFNLLDENKENKENNNTSSQRFISKIVNKIKKGKNTEEEKEYEDSHIQILMNFTPIVNIINKSLEIISKGNFSNNNHLKYFNNIIRFYGYYLRENIDNCVQFLNSRILRIFTYISPEYIEGIVDILLYISKIFKRKLETNITEIKPLLKVLEVLIKKISETNNFSIFKKILKILMIISKIKFLHPENSMNKIRKALKHIFFENKTFQKFRNILLETCHEELNEEEEKEESERPKTLSELIEENIIIDGYNLENLTILFTKFLKIINYLFDGNSTLNELDFLSKIFEKKQIPLILNDKTLNLPLRIQLIRFYRLAYIDVLIESSKMKDYLTLIANDIELKEAEQNFSSFIFIQNLIKVGDNTLDMHIDCDLLNNELQYFNEIVKNNTNKNIIAKYFEQGLVLPLYVFINKYISIIYKLNGNEYIKLYEIVLNFLETKKFILEEGIKLENEFEESLKQNNVLQALTKTSLNKFYILMKKITKNHKDEFNDLKEDLRKLQDGANIEILDYKLIYYYFEKHIIPFVKIEGLQDLQEEFTKKTKFISFEEIDEKIDELKKEGKIQNEFMEKMNQALMLYDNYKINYMESSLSQNLTEKNVIYDTTYRSIYLRPMFYLINSEKLYIKYRRQNLYHIFRLLQYDTQNTQDDIYKLRKLDIEKFKMDKKNKELNQNIINENIDNDFFNDISPINKKINLKENSNTSLIAINKELIDNKINILNQPFFKSNINLHYIIHLFMENFLSVIFAKYNPSSFANHEDYFIAYMSIKIMKYLCEDHNINFQTLFFKNIFVDTNEEHLNVFDLMMCILNKILILSKWNEVNYETDESSITYFYDLFFCVMEFSIEMIQGTSKDNLLNIIDSVDDKENTHFFKFLYYAKKVLQNNYNDNQTLYKARLDIANFITAFVEERNTPIEIITILENIFNPLLVFDSIVATLKKLYLKIEGLDNKLYNEIEFDQKKCELFINKYFSDSEFSKNQEFELSNRMFYYVKQLSFYDNKDAKNLLYAIQNYTPEKIYELKNLRNNDLNDTNDASESVLVDSRFFQHYFAAKFFESITKIIWIRGEDKQSTMVLFTLDPSVQFLSENSKFEFYENVPRDSRSSKLFSLIEYTDYFCIEINQNQKKISNNFVMKLINKVNLSYLDLFIYVLNVVINLVIYSLTDYKDKNNDFKKVWKIIFPLGIVQLSLTILALTFWFVTKYKLYFKIEKIKYKASLHISKETPLSTRQHLYLGLIKTIFSKREMINFIWDLIFSILGILGSNFIFVYSIQLLIIVNISSTLQSITKAIAMRYFQLLTLFMFLILAIYIFSTIAFFNFSSEFLKEREGNIENICGSLFYCFLTHIEFGLRTDGGIGEHIDKVSYYENKGYFMGMFFFQFIFYLLIIVIMLSVVGGSVIDTFAELREKKSRILNDMNNVCFICNGIRNDIEKQGEIFEEHIEKVHSLWTYLDYIIGLKFVDPQETNAINSFIIEQLNEKKISWFPSFIDENDNGNENNEDEDN